MDRAFRSCVAERIYNRGARPDPHDHIASTMQLAAAPLPRGEIPAVESSAWPAFLTACVREAFARARAAQEVPKRARGAGADAVQCGAAPSASAGRLHRAQWHTRASRHAVPYDAFVRGLFEEHTRHEQEYIESLERVTCLESLGAHVGVWQNEYRLPPLTANRDFV